MNVEMLIEVVSRHLLSVMNQTDFDVVPADDGEQLDISTDHWTLHLEGAGGFLAIDEEPIEPAAFAPARRAVMSDKVERALVAADRELDGALSTALTVSGDPFSLDFVSVLTDEQRMTRTED
jgi:hypothetical protein